MSQCTTQQTADSNVTCQMNKIIKCNSTPRTFDFQLFTQLPLEATSNGKILQLLNPIPVCSDQASMLHNTPYYM